METIKVIFLDVDGVLNSKRTIRMTKNGCVFVGVRQVKNLRRIVRETGAKVVLSSDWRYGRIDARCNEDFLELKRELAKYGIEFHDYTPETFSGHRGEEIHAWLTGHPEVSNFVILDDRQDIEPHKDHWVQTCMSRGLGKEETEAAIQLLNGG